MILVHAYGVVGALVAFYFLNEINRRPANRDERDVAKQLNECPPVYVAAFVFYVTMWPIVLISLFGRPRDPKN